MGQTANEEWIQRCTVVFLLTECKRIACSGKKLSGAGGDREPSEMGDLLVFSSDAVKFLNQQTL